MRKICQIMLSIIVSVFITITAASPISAATTTAQTRCTNNNNHSMSCGNIGRWFNSRSDIETYWKNQCNALAEKWDKEEISDSEYYSKSPYGYECWSCSYCGKWTGDFKYRDTTESTTSSHKHTWNSGKVTKKATCTTTGIKTYTCTSCKATKTSTISALGHNYNKTIVKPTCTQSGYTKYVCSRCGDTYKSDYQSAIGHNYSYTSNNDKTHTVICTNNCGIKYTENCSLQYNGENYICTYCKAKYEKETTTAKDNNTTVHTHTWDAGKITTAPTCISTGVKTYTCTSCGTTRTENIDKIEHDYNCEINQATCTEDGYAQYTCKYCGYSYQYITEYAIGHIYEYVSNGDGTHYQRCTRCGYKAANQECIKINNGSDYVCRYCDYVFPRRVTTTLESTSTETTNKENNTKVSSIDTSNTSASETTVHTHTWDAGKVTTAPTCISTGIKTYTCTSCGATKIIYIDKTEHYFNKTVIPSTTASEGYTIYECNNCHYSYKTDYTKKIETPQTSSQNNTTTISTTGLNTTQKVTTTNKITVAATKQSTTINQTTFENTKNYYCKNGTYSKPKNTSISKLKKGKKAIIVKWKKVSGIKGYQIQIATDKKFKKNVKSVVVNKQKTVTTTVKKLKSNKKYYVRIRTYKISNNKKVYSSWSKVKSVVTK